MYGSNFQIEQALTRKSLIETSVVGNQSDSKSSKKSWLLALVVACILSSVAFAGPSQPRLPGGNGDSRGR
jgi:hypothetical protein